MVKVEKNLRTKMIVSLSGTRAVLVIIRYGYLFASRWMLDLILTGCGLQALGLKRLSIHTSFFEAGGTSLLAGMASLRLNQILGSDFSALLFFNHPTIAAAASHIHSQTQDGGQIQTAAPAIMPAGFTEAEKQAGLPCSFNQAQMISHGMQSAYALAYNQPFVFRMQGRLSLDVLQVRLV